MTADMSCVGRYRLGLPVRYDFRILCHGQLIDADWPIIHAASV